MISWPREVYVATAPVNLHFSFDRLAGVVREQLGADPRQQAVFVFHNRRRTHVKLLWHDGGGYMVLYKRLDRGTYRIPLAIPPGAAKVQVTQRELAQVLRGIDQRLLRSARRELRGACVRRRAES
jgi:transposase